MAAVIRIASCARAMASSLAAVPSSPPNRRDFSPWRKAPRTYPAASPQSSTALISTAGNAARASATSALK